MSPVSLKTALGDHPHTQAVKDGTITPAGFTLDFVEVKPMIAAFRRMVRTLEFDVCELAPTTYIAARDAGVPLTALPVFLTRRFHHGDIVCRPGSGIAKPADLEGRRVGVRAYTVSTGVWVRGILENDYDVDLDSVTWVVDDEEHVESYVLPSNVSFTPEGESIAGQFHDGKIDAALSGPAGIGRSGAPTENWSIAGAGFEDARKPTDDFYPLFKDARMLEKEWFDRTGIYPIHGLIALKTDVVREHPNVVESLMRAFTEAKARVIDDLVAGQGEGKEYDRYSEFAGIVGSDPLPYGIEANRATLESLCDSAVSQRIVAKRPEVDDLFICP